MFDPSREAEKLFSGRAGHPRWLRQAWRTWDRWRGHDKKEPFSIAPSRLRKVLAQTAGEADLSSCDELFAALRETGFEPNAQELGDERMPAVLVNGEADEISRWLTDTGLSDTVFLANNGDGPLVIGPRVALEGASRRQMHEQMRTAGQIAQRPELAGDDRPKLSQLDESQAQDLGIDPEQSPRYSL
jgi:hypothetical protein